MSGSNKFDDRQQDSAQQPSWINKPLIEQALRNGGEVNYRVQAIAVRRALAEGENYGSTIYRVTVTLSDGMERSFIIKGPTVAGLSEATQPSGTFQREITMFTDCIPKMEALLEESAPGRFPRSTPRCYHHATCPVKFLVMEDLRPAGFRLADRKRGLGLRHSLLALRTLARFHAASHALLRRKPQLAGELDNMLNVADEGHQAFVRGELEATAIACRSWPGFQGIAERLEKLKSISGVVFDKINAPEQKAFNVIAHGDFWTNNLMYRYEDENPEEVRAVDLQLAHVCSPVIDILHLFSNSVSDNVHLHHQHLLLREYHVELQQTLEILGLEAPSLESLQAAMDTHGSYALYFALELPIVKSDEGLDLDAISRGDYRELLQVLETPGIKKRLQRSLQEYARKGWLPV